MIKRILIFIFLFIGTCINLQAQKSSTYTRVGIGDPVYAYSGRRLGMGELGTAVSDKDFIGTLNPASWKSLTRTRIEFGLMSGGSKLTDENSSYYSAEGQFNGFTIGFPASTDNGVGIVLGVVPYTNVSYLVKSSPAGTAGSPGYEVEYEGRGGLSKVFIGSSYILPYDIAIGAAFDYYFGNLNYYSRVNFPEDDSYDSEYKRTYSPYSMGGTFGIISPDLSGLFNSESISELRLGFAADWISRMKADTTLESSTSLFSDTLGYGIVKMKVPLRISMGLSFLLNKTIMFSFDYLHQGMEDYTFNGLNNPNLKGNNKFSLGFEFRPELKPGDTFWEQIILRAGLGYEELPYTFNGTDINEYSVTGGFSLPLSLENTLDIGIQYATRGEVSEGLHKEQRIRINLGLSLSDTWFVRQEK